MTIASWPPFCGSMCATARMRMRPRPVSYASRMPWKPITMPAVGKSGPLTCCIRPSVVISGIVDQRDRGVDHLAEVVRRDVRRHADRDARAAVHEQVREARGQDDRDHLAARRSSARSRRRPRRGRAASRPPWARAGTRCSAWPPRRSRRRCRSCPGRRRADSATRTAARAARARRRSRRRRADGSRPCTRRRPSRTSRTARFGCSPSCCIEKRTRRCTGLSPSRASGSARPTITLIA